MAVLETGPHNSKRKVDETFENSNNITISPIERIKPNPGNARTHPDEQVAQIARSIDEFGFTQPILVDENTMVLAGNGKLRAAQKLNLTEVPILVIAGLTEMEKRLYVIADNQIALNSTWDQEKLRTAIQELERELATLELTGLSPQEIDRVLADLAPEQGWTDEDEAPAVLRTAITRPGGPLDLGSAPALMRGRDVARLLRALAHGPACGPGFL